MLAVFNCPTSWNRKIASQVIMLILFIKKMLQMCSGTNECLTLYIKIKISCILFFARLGRLALSRVSTIIVDNG